METLEQNAVCVRMQGLPAGLLYALLAGQE